MLSYSSVSKWLIVILAILFTASCATTRTIYDIKDRKLPTYMVGKTIKVYTRDNSSVEFAIQKADSTFIYGENDNPKIRRDEVIKIEVPNTFREYHRHFLIGAIIYSLLSIVLVP